MRMWHGMAWHAMRSLQVDGSCRWQAAAVSAAKCRGCPMQSMHQGTLALLRPPARLASVCPATTLLQYTLMVGSAWVLRSSYTPLHRFLQDSSSYVLYPFGFGLSYTTFAYSSLRVVAAGSEGCLNPGEGPAMCVVVTVTNTGGTGYKKPAEHVVPLYLTQMTLAVRPEGWEE